MNPEELLFNLKDRPSMFGITGSFDAYSAFLSGYQHAEEGSWLLRFSEWLSQRLGCGSNMGWQTLVTMAAFPDDSEKWGVRAGRTTADDEVLVSTLLMLLHVYLADVLCEKS
ncbi:hypothetical protein [Nocardia xishanensis]|uniref:hypothetical protein n=1 Tax=Nocardia xishanensis TaxID=238964 RepID=UPI003422A6B8